MAEHRRRSSRHHLWLLLPAAALAALWLAWRALAAVDFLYPVFYDALDIETHIAVYGPQNRHKAGFEQTTREERLRLFSAIVDSIHASGDGLAEIEYFDPLGRPIDRLLREPEVGHLEDVAWLVDGAAVAGWLAAAWAAVHLLLIRILAWPVPALSRMLLFSLLATAAAVGLLLLAGPRRVFYWAHDLVFPPDHPWFFYYQDSLMTTLMKAPDLFGAIAAALLVVALALYAGLLWLATRLQRPA